MFFKEITSRGALAPLTGCKLKSSYILKGQLPNNFYCLQSDLLFLPSELPWLTLVQLKSETQQSEVGELCMTCLTSIHHIPGALNSPWLPSCFWASPLLARLKAIPGSGAWQRHGRVNAIVICEGERSCTSLHRVGRYGYLSAWSTGPTTSLPMSFLTATKGACLISHSLGNYYAYLAWLFLSITTGFAGWVTLILLSLITECLWNIWAHTLRKNKKCQK